MSQSQTATSDQAQVQERGLQLAFDNALHEGRSRLNRSTSTLLATGAIGGAEVGLGVLALLLVRHQTGNELLGALAFAIGFIALILGQSELFTENFLVPVMAVFTEDSQWFDVARLWGGTLATNLIGGWIVMGLVVVGIPELADSEVIIDAAQHYVEMGITWASLANAILAGATITLMTWMERSSRDLLGKLTAVIVVAFLLAGVPLLHAIVASVQIFAALHAGAPFGYLDWLGMLGWAALGNIIGGVLLVTGLRILQAPGELSEVSERLSVPEDEGEAGEPVGRRQEADA